MPNMETKFVFVVSLISIVVSLSLVVTNANNYGY